MHQNWLWPTTGLGFADSKTCVQTSSEAETSRKQHLKVICQPHAMPSSLAFTGNTGDSEETAVDSPAYSKLRIVSRNARKWQRTANYALSGRGCKLRGVRCMCSRRTAIMQVVNVSQMKY